MWFTPLLRGDPGFLSQDRWLDASLSSHRPQKDPRSKLLRFRHLGSPQRRRLSWACVLCPSQVRAAQVMRCLASAVAATYSLLAAGFSGCRTGAPSHTSTFGNSNQMWGTHSKYSPPLSVNRMYALFLINICISMLSHFSCIQLCATP